MSAPNTADASRTEDRDDFVGWVFTTATRQFLLFFMKQQQQLRIANFEKRPHSFVKLKAESSLRETMSIAAIGTFRRAT